MFTIKEVVSLKKPSSSFPFPVELLEIKIDIEVSSDDSMYSEKGNYLVVKYDKVNEEIYNHYFYEKETDKYIKLSFTEPEEEVVLAFLKDFFVGHTFVL